MTADGIRLALRLVLDDAAGVARILDTQAAPSVFDREDTLAEGLAVVLPRAIGNLPHGVRVPAGHIDAIERRQRRQEERATILLRALAGVADLFAAAGQAFILLKGPYLAARFYGDMAGREFVDLDLLVPSADRARASRLLEAAGYTMRSRIIGGEGITSFFVHGFDFVAGNAYLDLHWGLSRHPSLLVDEARIRALQRTYVLGGREYSVLSDEHELVFGALSLLRDIERGRPKPKNVIDIVLVAAAADATMDWEAVLEHARREGTLGPLVNVLALCLDVADANDLTPRLSAVLDRHARRVRGRPSGDPFSFRPIPWGIGNKWWSARVHDTTPLTWLLWWTTSLPFRMAVHRPYTPPPATSGVEARP